MHFKISGFAIIKGILKVVIGSHELEAEIHRAGVETGHILADSVTKVQPVIR